MTDRVEAALEGEVPRDDLSAEERAAVSAFEARMTELRGALGARMPADLDARVMRRIRDQGLEPLPELGRPALGFHLLASLWAPREVSFRFRPAYGLAAAAVAAAVLLLPGRGAPRLEEPGVGPTEAVSGSVLGSRRGRIYVQFRLQAQDAENVSLAGSFSDWQPAYPMQRTADGVWTVLLPVTPGVHDYAFVVDGEEWVPDPYAPQVDDGFGGVNSRLTLLTPEDGP